MLKRKDKENAQRSVEDYKPKPKPKEQVLKELEDLRKKLGLKRTDGTMSNTHRILKRKGSMSDALTEMRKKEKQ
jgi:hypothetical protein